ncbi:fic family toxin-antitoxin system, toxin component [Streptomyces sp. NPDC090088]|uniref:fic family toxin-antitoxin system, toxin component n=1 Tax=Streptomyces sp. NPDC090088 TaxID=3365944 RepID=UPI0037FA24BF
MIAEQNTPGDPVVSDWGALMAAVSRVHAEIFGIPVYDTPPQRAAALLQQLINVPALERGNALFAAAAAYGYLAACGLKITTSPEEVRDLVRRAAEGADIYAIASTLKSWIL